MLVGFSLTNAFEVVFSGGRFELMSITPLQLETRFLGTKLFGFSIGRGLGAQKAQELPLYHYHGMDAGV